jgi:hypothetical protein
MKSLASILFIAAPAAPWLEIRTFARIDKLVKVGTPPQAFLPE